MSICATNRRPSHDEKRCSQLNFYRTLSHINPHHSVTVIFCMTGSEFVQANYGSEQHSFQSNESKRRLTVSPFVSKNRAANFSQLLRTMGPVTYSSRNTMLRLSIYAVAFVAAAKANEGRFLQGSTAPDNVSSKLMIHVSACHRPRGSPDINTSFFLLVVGYFLRVLCIRNERNKIMNLSIWHFNLQKLGGSYKKKHVAALFDRNEVVCSPNCMHRLVQNVSGIATSVRVVFVSCGHAIFFISTGSVSLHPSFRDHFQSPQLSVVLLIHTFLFHLFSRLFARTDPPRTVPRGWLRSP